MARRRLATRFKQTYPKPRGKGFKPFKPVTRPPAGTYDPTLDAAERASGRGLADLTLDIDPISGRDTERATSDYLLGRGNVIRQRTEGLADLMRQRGSIDLNYNRLGGRQAQSLNQAGVAGGAYAQAAQKRLVNKTADLVPVGINETRLKEGTDRRLGELATAFRRGGEDRTQTLTRAQRENLFFSNDTSAARFFQAKQTGYSPDLKPKNEYTRHGLTFQLKGKGKARQYTFPSGETLSRKQYVKRVRNQRMRGA